MLSGVGRLTSGSPSTARGSETDTPPGVPAPSVGVAVLALGTSAELDALLAALVPSSREYRVEVVVVARGAADQAVEETDLLRVVALGAEATEEAMRRQALIELTTDVVVFTSDREPLAADWSAVLPRLTQVVVSREEAVSSTDWFGVLRRLDAAEPGA